MVEPRPAQMSLRPAVEVTVVDARAHLLPGQRARVGDPVFAGGTGALVGLALTAWPPPEAGAEDAPASPLVAVLVRGSAVVLNETGGALRPWDRVALRRVARGGARMVRAPGRGGGPGAGGNVLVVLGEGAAPGEQVRVALAGAGADLPPHHAALARHLAAPAAEARVRAAAAALRRVR